MKFDASQYMYIHYSVKILMVVMALILIILAATWEEIIDHFDDDGIAFKVVLQLYIYLGLIIAFFIVCCGYSCYMDVNFPMTREEE